MSQAGFVLVWLVCYATARPCTELHIGGSLPVSIQTEGHVTALLLVLGPRSNLQMNPGGEAQRSILLYGGDTNPAENASLPEAKNCRELFDLGLNSSGVYSIRPYDCCPDRTVDVFCDMATDGGGWTVVQRRDKYDTQEDFFRSWEEYKNGFGNQSREFWLGLDHIHALANQSDYEARIDLGDFEGGERFAKYYTFDVADEADFYQIKIQGYSGDAGNSMAHHDGRKFTTKDKDNDAHGGNCATEFSGAWWYGSCLNSNLNGQYLNGPTEEAGNGIIWHKFKGNDYSLKKTEIKIRPKQ